MAGEGTEGEGLEELDWEKVLEEEEPPQLWVMVGKPPQTPAKQNAREGTELKDPEKAKLFEDEERQQLWVMVAGKRMEQQDSIKLDREKLFEKEEEEDLSQLWVMVAKPQRTLAKGMHGEDLNSDQLNEMRNLLVKSLQEKVARMKRHSVSHEVIVKFEDGGGRTSSMSKARRMNWSGVRSLPSQGETVVLIDERVLRLKKPQADQLDQWLCLNRFT